MIYRLYSRGSALEGEDQLAVLSNLTALLRSDVNHVKNLLLSGQPYPIKSSASHAELRVVERRLLAVGLDAFIHEYDPEELSDPILTSDFTTPLITEADIKADLTVTNKLLAGDIKKNQCRKGNWFFRLVRPLRPLGAPRFKRTRHRHDLEQRFIEPQVTSNTREIA